MSKVLDTLELGTFEKMLVEEETDKQYFTRLDERSKKFTDFYEKWESVISFSKKHSVHMEFSEPVRLWYGHRKSKEDTHHVLKGLHLDGGYYTAGRLRTNCYPLPKITKILKVSIVQDKEDYSTQWRNIAESMLEHNINIKLAKEILEHLEGERDKFYWRTKERKPKKMSFKEYTVDAGYTMEDMKRIAREKVDEKYGHFWNGDSGWRYKAKRDKSVSMYYKKEEDTFMFASASEYHGTGNGDYYIMYSPTMAFFGETD